MENDIIVGKCEEYYRQIKAAQDGLTEIRAICKHEKTSEKKYSFRPGSCDNLMQCDYCGEVNFKSVLQNA